MAEAFRPLSDFPECDDLKSQKIKNSQDKLSIKDLYESDRGDVSDYQTDDDMKGMLLKDYDACINSTTKQLSSLINISNENKEVGIESKISNNEEDDSNLLDLQKSKLNYKKIEGYTEKSGEVTHLVTKGESLGKIIQSIYGYDNWFEISKEIEKAKVYNLSKGIVLSDNIKEGQKISLFIEDIDTVAKRLADRQEEARLKRALENQKELEKLDKQRTDRQATEEEENSFFKAEILDTGHKLSLAPFSGELNPDALEVYKGMKNTKGEQAIGKYRNKDGEVEDIILGDNRGKNIYMELNGSYTWDDIDSGKIDNIGSKDELEKVMIKLLKIYEKENREDYY